MLEESIIRNRGNVVGVSTDLGLGFQGAVKYVRKHGLWDLVRGARKRAEAPPPWLVRTLAVIEGGRMEAIQQLYESAAGMSIEEVTAEIEASQHAGMVDAATLAEAIVVGAGAMAEAGG